MHTKHFVTGNGMDMWTSTEVTTAHTRAPNRTLNSGSQRQNPREDLYAGSWFGEDNPKTHSEEVEEVRWERNS